MIACLEPCPLCGRGRLLVDHDASVIAHSVPSHRRCDAFASVKTVRELGEAVDRYAVDVARGEVEGFGVRMTVETQLDGPPLALRRTQGLAYRRL